MKLLILLICTVLFDKSYADESLPVEPTRDGKVLPVFQVVRFPNDACAVSGGAKNGTCYTAEECSNKGGTNGGSCASGFGVCCIFTLGCGGASTENCTYFEVTSAPTGGCNGRVCKCNSNICQMRLDFTNFVISGPSTLTASLALQTNGVVANAGKAFSLRGNCLTDSFTVSGAPGVPELCGTLTGEHIYFDADDECHDLSFNVGQTGIGVTAATTRSFNIKVTQVACNSGQLAPEGCLQYLTGISGTGVIKTFNFDTGIHLANQNQQICFRREQGMCRTCFSAGAATDVLLGGKGTKGVTKHDSCCAYGIDGAKSTGVYDCIILPGASKAAADGMTPDVQCGGAKGLVTATNVASKTICTANEPFRIAFVSDGIELSVASPADAGSTGFKLEYYQVTC